LANSQTPDEQDQGRVTNSKGEVIQYRSGRQLRLSMRIAVVNLLVILLAFISLFQVAKTPQNVLFFSLLALVLYLFQAMIPRTVDGKSQWERWNPRSMILTVGAPVLFSGYAVLVTVLGQ